MKISRASAIIPLSTLYIYSYFYHLLMRENEIFPVIIFISAIIWEMIACPIESVKSFSLNIRKNGHAIFSQITADAL